MLTFILSIVKDDFLSSLLTICLHLLPCRGRPKQIHLNAFAVHLGIANSLVYITIITQLFRTFYVSGPANMHFAVACFTKNNYKVSLKFTVQNYTVLFLHVMAPFVLRHTLIPVKCY